MELEEETRKRNKKANLKKIILETVTFAGLLSVALVAPKALGAMKKLGLMPHPRQKESIEKTRALLVEKGLLEFKNGNLQTTKKGRIYLIKKLSFSQNQNNQNKEKKQKWDGRWRVLVFDIPETKRFERDQIRHALCAIGFLRLQDSVWIYPHKCEDLINLLKADLEVGKDVLYMIVDTLEYDKPVKKYFGLK